ncbi:hypothetical protein GCM10010365_46290 [Streptomyces poonensis]|uniref:Uncharacterized protein n=1 Tax=Streptomyces poonensis TaxID=68255 RepID=A0A918PS89_9ACTN|nr:hypothetical protein GCM10010365_46290 [Streptomyces poonensis]
MLDPPERSPSTGCRVRSLALGDDRDRAGGLVQDRVGDPAKLQSASVLGAAGTDDQQVEVVRGGLEHLAGGAPAVRRCRSTSGTPGADGR